MAWKRLRLLAAPLLAVAMLLSSAVVGAPSNAATLAATNTGLRNMALGVSMMPYDDLTVLDQFTASVGGQVPAIWSVWSDWGNPGNAAFPTELMSGLRQRGVVPMVFWQPVDPSDVNGPIFTFGKIIAGDFDEYIREWAQAAKDSGGVVIVRFAHEMDGIWFPWGVGRFDNTPARFVAAWQHIWNIFKGPGGVGATNVGFLWSPYLPCSCSSGIYPGDGYVDYVGFTGLNWGPPQAWRSMKQAFKVPMRELSLITQKPVIVAEMGSSPLGGDKAAWIRDGYPAVYDAYPSIKAIVYFNVDTSPGQVDWRLTTPAEALTAYTGVLANPRFQSRLDTWPPTAQAPAASLLAGARLAATPRLHLAWPAATDDTGVTAYTFQLRTDTGPWSAVALASPTATAADVALAAGSHHYSVRVRAADAVGNTSAWATGTPFKVSLIQETAAAITYAGSFARAALAGASRGYVRYASAAGRSATLAFTGSSVAFVTTRGPDRGKATVWLDGVQVASLDLYAASTKPAWIAFATTVSPGPHTLQVRISGTKNAKSSGKRLDIDAFVVLG